MSSSDQITGFGPPAPGGVSRRRLWASTLAGIPAAKLAALAGLGVDSSAASAQPAKKIMVGAHLWCMPLLNRATIRHPCFGGRLWRSVRRGPVSTAWS